MLSHRPGVAATVCGLATALLCAHTRAEEAGSKVALEPPALAHGMVLNLAPNRRYFLKFGGVFIKVNDKPSPAYDVTGPVFVHPDQDAQANLVPSNPTLNTMFLDNIFGPYASLGTPDNATANVKNARGLFGSVGVFLDDQQHWAVEALVLALPFKQTASGTGVLDKLGDVIETKFLPPMVIGSYYFGDKQDRLRLSAGLGMSYVMFFDSQASQSLSDYMGGETDVRIANRFSYGAFVGAKLQVTERWSLNLTVGQLRLKTTATLTTQDTMFTADSAVLRDYNNPNLTATIDSPTTKPALNTALANVAAARGGNLGTYVRKMDLTLNPYIFMLTAGYAF